MSNKKGSKNKRSKHLEFEFGTFEYGKNAYLLKKYGIGLTKYREMALEQDHRCAICGTHQSNLKEFMSVDHCHRTGRIRGLLCQYCNTGLGFFFDSPDNLLNAREYLSR